MKILSYFLSTAVLLLCIGIVGCQENAADSAFQQMWKNVQKMEGEQKYAAALEEVTKIYEKASAEKVQYHWTKSFIQIVLLKRGLHSCEDAVRFMLEQKWPQFPKDKALLHLFYANTLFDYYQNYSWEINQREKVMSKKELDLKKWAAFDIFQEIQNQYLSAYKYHEDLGKLATKEFDDYIGYGNYPGNIRSTMKDFLIYQWADFLGNTNTWRPVELKEKYKLNFLSLAVAPERRNPAAADLLEQESVHPVVKMVHILDVLYQWHMKEGRQESAMESQLERIRKLSLIFNKKEEIDILLQSLDNMLPMFESYPWWATGKYEYAVLLQNKEELVQAYNVAQEGERKYPSSLGGRKCAALIRALEIPHFDIKSMRLDRIGTNSIEISHKNMTKLYFRIYQMNFSQWMSQKYRYLGSIYSDDLRNVIHKNTPKASWEVALTDVRDFKIHKTYVTPEVKENGFYIVAASVAQDFNTSANCIVGTYMFFSDIVTLASQREGGWEVFVLNGLTGRPVHDAKVTLYQYDYNQGPIRMSELTTLSEGKVFFPYQDRSRSCFIVAKWKDQISFDPNSIYFGRYGMPSQLQHGCFIYTDRSIYRPLQKVYYKIVTCTGNPQKAEYKCLANTDLEISFFDPNYKIIEKVNAKTNAYGTASGEFNIPAGRVLGQYFIQCNVNQRFTGHGYIRVEEYKRPTFEVTLKKPEKELKLNEKISVTGESQYYFGLPVSTGKVFYRVTRTPVWPWWYWWFYGASDESRHTYEIAAGNATLKADGTFAIEFVPQADPSFSNEKNISYNYKVDVEVTDEGGETRTATSSYPIGFVSVRAEYEMEYNYFLPEDDTSVSIVRSDLSGVPREGDGSYKLVRLEQPKEVMTPDKFPIVLPKDAKNTPGDLIRPRWEGDKTLQQYLFVFKDANVVKEGSTSHDKEGKAQLNLGKLEPGAYRLYYSTKDAWGSLYETRREFIVAGPNFKIAVPFFILARKNNLKVGEDAHVFMGSGIENQCYHYEVCQNSSAIEREFIENGARLFKIKIDEKHRGGFSLRIFSVHDYQVYSNGVHIQVPWDNKHLQVSFKKFRNLLRPGQKETWTVAVKGPNSEVVAAEILSYMYDKSLDMFVPHNYPNLNSLFPYKQGIPYFRQNIFSQYFSHIYSGNWFTYLENVSLTGDRFKVFDRYGIGGLGTRQYAQEVYLDGDGDAPKKMAEAPAPTMAKEESSLKAKAANGNLPGKPQQAPVPAPPAEAKPEEPKDAQQKQESVPIRQKFHETAFFKPHLITDENGEAQIEFDVPDSVTAWNVYVHAVTKDIKFMTAQEKVVTSKDMMVRPYMPRFFREGDEAVLKVVINNATKEPLGGDVTLAIFDQETNEDKSKDFGVTVFSQTWKAQGRQSDNVSWSLKAPHSLKTYAFKVIARSKDYSDGELRPLPVLPSRMHLVQSKFITLKDKQTRTLYIPDLEKSAQDPTLVHQSLVVTLDAQLVYTALKALPYLVEYPYECVEQTLNRFLSTGIVTSLYSRYPAIAKMAKDFSTRKTQLDTWKADDPNRKMSLEETPWLQTAEGGEKDMSKLINVLDERIATTQREISLQKLQEAQLGNGAFPWWAGGPPSPYMTLYLLHGFAKAQEFNVAIPKEMVRKAWIYMALHFRDYYAGKMIKENYGYEFISFLNYVLSCYKDHTYYSGSFNSQERQDMLTFCFKHWKKMCPYTKAYLALTLMRMDRPADARLVMESIMDSAVTKEDQGTFWAPEDRGWLWYNDNIESHAFVLRALQEVMPDNKKQIDGLVLWLLLNKKMNQWKSTRTTAEVVYSLVYTVQKQGALAVEEKANVTVGEHKKEFVFEPDKYSGNRQVVFSQREIVPEMAKAVVSKETPGFMFASMTWHYSTEKLPEEARGDFLAVTRQYFLRKHQGQEYVLRPIAEGTQIEVGDQVEVHLSIRSKHPMEYVHLRDPRGAGFEPEKAVSGHRWDLGIYWYEEIRDSATNFFFEYLPQGEYNFKYRIRATMAGKFRVGPAVIQNMYAPEFAAFSSGTMLTIR